MEAVSRVLYASNRVQIDRALIRRNIDVVFCPFLLTASVQDRPKTLIYVKW